MTARTCDGTDAELLREQVTRTSHAGQETVNWVPCACGERFDDTQRVLVYPHYYLPHNMDEKARKAIARRISELVAGGKSAEEIRQWLTSQPVGDMVESVNATTKEGSSMDEQFGTGPTGEQDENTAVVSAEGTGSTADRDATDDALDTEREGVDDAAAEAEEQHEADKAEVDSERASGQNPAYPGSGF